VQKFRLHPGAIYEQVRSPSFDPYVPAPRVAMTNEHKTERSPSGGFVAFWRNQAIYEKGRMKKFPAEEDARAFLARCDAAGKIIHED
jgi:hypothetical protein